MIQEDTKIKTQNHHYHILDNGNVWTNNVQISVKGKYYYYTIWGMNNKLFIKCKMPPNISIRALVQTIISSVGTDKLEGQLI
jgi:hypothetical protein